MLWAVLENHLAVVVACAPSMKVVFLLLHPRLASTTPKIISRFTYSRSQSRPLNREIGEIILDYDEGASRRKSPHAKLDVDISEGECRGAPPSPMTPVFFADWRRNGGWDGSRRKEGGEEGWIYVGERGVRELQMGHKICVERGL
jgi:hypothetical protein